MSEKILTKEIAELFIADDYSDDLTEFTKIDDDAAESLSRFNGGNEECLALDGLTELSDEAAGSLSKYQGGRVTLNGISKLTDAAFEYLSNAQVSLELDGIRELSDSAANSLSKHEGGLSLLSLYEISDFAAKCLARHKDRGWTLRLNGIVTLSDEAAESLSKHNGMLSLYGLKNLSEDAVESLSRHRGSIELDKKLEEKVENLQVSHSKEADEFFCNKSITLNDKNVEKFLDLLKYDFCAFDYVKEIDVVAAGSLSDFRKNDYLELNGLKELSDSAAEILSKHKGDLYLNGLEELSDDVAATLSSHNNELRLSGITELSDTAAKNISRHVGALRLNGLKTLSDNAAENLSMKEGRLSLLGITQLSDNALKNLGKRKNKLDLNQDMEARVVPYREAQEKILENQKVMEIKDRLSEKERDQYEALIDEYKEADGSRKWEIYSLFGKNGWGTPY